MRSDFVKNFCWRKEETRRKRKKRERERRRMSFYGEGLQKIIVVVSKYLGNMARLGGYKWEKRINVLNTRQRDRKRDREEGKRESKQ